MKKRVVFALILTGFTSMACQIVQMRELLLVFYGNELSLGFTLASWLFWTAFGSYWPGRCLPGKIKQKSAVYAFTQLGLAVILPLSTLAIRFVPSFFGFSPGEIIGFFQMGLVSFVLLFPVCVLSGFLFVLGCEIYKGNTQGAESIGYVYILEAIGAAAGGLLTSFCLIRAFNSLHIMSLLGLLNLLSGCLLLYKRRILAFLAGIAFLAYGFLILSGGIDALHRYSLRKQWRGFEVLASENSVYGNITVTKRDNLYSFFTSGLYDFTVSDELTAERNAHFPLLEHPAPKEVLLIGGGVSGLLNEVLKHPVERVDYVELDPLLVKLAKRYLTGNEPSGGGKVNVITDMDGRRYVRITDKKYDAVIMNLPEPYTAQLNRFYTLEFFYLVKNILKDNGLFSFCLYSNPNYISPEQVSLYSALRETLEKVFPELRLTPGEANYFLCSKQKGALSLDWRFLAQRLKDRGIQAKYFREYYLYNELSSERIDFFEKSLSKARRSRINRDFHPMAYYYDLVLWSSQFKYGLKNFLQALSPKKIYLGALILYLFLALPIFFKPLRLRAPNWGVLACVATTGFAEISFQIITLLSYQVLYGYVYYKLGIILTSYMLGLILGGWLITRNLSGRANRALFIKTQGAICVYPLALPLLFGLFSRLKGPFSFWLGSNIVFPFLPVIAGFIGGYQFPLANSLYLKTRKTGVGNSAGLTYGIDLFGSCLGAALTLIILVPVIGIYQLCIFAAGLNLIGLLLLLNERRQ